MVLKQAAVARILDKAAQPFNHLVIRRRNVIRNLALDLTQNARKTLAGTSARSLLPPELIQRWGLNGEWSLANRVPKYQGQEWAGKVIYGSPLVDIASSKELAAETVEMCEMILRLSNLDIRLLSKSPLLAEVARELDKRLPDATSGAKARIIFGFSTGTLDDAVAAAIETHTPAPSARLKALHRLQDAGFRTFGMLCPILPKKEAQAYASWAQAAMEKIRADRCEEIWAEPVNFRAGSAGADKDQKKDRNSFAATLQALRDGGFTDEAARFETVANDTVAWEDYSRSLFEALLKVTPQQTIPKFIAGEKVRALTPSKLWWMHYPRSFESIEEYWNNQQVNGALLVP